MISFTIPVAAKSVQTGGKRMMIRGGKPLFFKDKATDTYDKSIIALAARHRPVLPLTGPLRVAIEFFLSRPKNRMRKCDAEGSIWCDKRPDIDNLVKGVLDPLTKLGFWQDDSQITTLVVSKCYHMKNGAAYISIQVSPQ